MPSKWMKVNNLFFVSDRMNGKDFMHGQVCCNTNLFVAYKSVVAILSWSAFISHVCTYPNKLHYPLYLQHWVALVVNSYLFLSLCCIFHGFYQQKRIKSRHLRSRKSRNRRNKEVDFANFDGSGLKDDIVRFITSRTSFTITETSQQNNQQDAYELRLHFIHQITWFFYETAFCLSLTICVVYWTFLDDIQVVHDLEKSEILRNIYVYLILVLVMTTEAFMCRYQTAFLHFLYTYLVGVIYMLFTCFVHVLRVEEVVNVRALPRHIYWYTAWDENSSWGILLCVGMIPVVMCLQMYLIGIHTLRDYLWRTESTQRLPKITVSSSGPTMI